MPNGPGLKNATYINEKWPGISMLMHHNTKFEKLRHRILQKNTKPEARGRHSEPDGRFNATKALSIADLDSEQETKLYVLCFTLFWAGFRPKLGPGTCPTAPA